MSEEPLTHSQNNLPEKISPNGFLEQYGVKELGTVFQGEVISAATEKSRLAEIAADGNARRQLALLNFVVKDALVHAVGIFLVLGLAAGGGLILSDNHASDEAKEWARTMLSAIGGSVAGYVFGKGSSKA
jgi:hypothetical protein